MHVSKAGQYMSCLAKVTILLVVAPQQVHIVHLTLVLLDHMHQMFLQIWRIHLYEVGPKNVCIYFKNLGTYSKGKKRQQWALECTCYLQQLISQISLNQPVVQSYVKQLILRPLGQTEHLLKLQAKDRFSL